MNITTSTGFALKSSRAYVLPSTAGRRKSGQGAPSSGGGVSTAMTRGILSQIGVEGGTDGERNEERSDARTLRGPPGPTARDRRASGGRQPSARGQPARVRGRHGAMPARDGDPRRRREEGRDAAGGGPHRAVRRRRTLR